MITTVLEPNNAESLHQSVLSLREGDFTNGCIESAYQKAKPYLSKLSAVIATQKNRGLPLAAAETIFKTMPHLSHAMVHNSNVILFDDMMQFRAVHHDIAGKRDAYTLSEAITQQYPDTANITLRLAADYHFAGLRNSWGFMSTPRQIDANTTGSASCSVTGIAHEIAPFLNCDPASAAVVMDKYQELWKAVNHDHLHVMFPSRSLAHLTSPNAPLRTHKTERYLVGPGFTSRHTDDNLERWAVVLHRELNPYTDPKDTKIYFAAAHHLQKMMANKDTKQEVQQLGEYLASIYLWPALMVAEKDGAVLAAIEAGINALDINKENQLSQICEALDNANLKSNRQFKAEAAAQHGVSIDTLSSGKGPEYDEARLDYIHKIAQKSTTKGERAVAGLIKSYGLDSNSPHPLSSFELIRLKTAIITHGYQEALHLDEPWLFEGKTAKERLLDYAKTYTQNIHEYRAHLSKTHRMQAMVAGAATLLGA